MKNIKIIIAFILGVVVSGIGVYALSINSKDVSYKTTNVSDAIDDLYEKLENTKIDLLWTNESPTTSFAEQTIAIDLSNYNGIIIGGVATTTNISQYPNDLAATTVRYISKGVVGNLVFGSIYGSGTASSIYKRGIYINNDNIVFENGIEYKNGQSTLNNNYAIPLKIYGVKGTLEG